MSERQKSCNEQGMDKHFFRASSEDFKKIPGTPLAYWISNTLRDSFQKQTALSEYFFSDGLTKTGSNERYLRFHWEVDLLKVSDQNKYRVCVKGGDARDFYGNVDVAINWTPAARSHYKTDIVARITPDYLWDATGISWTKISSKGPTFRWFGGGMIAETGGPAIFSKATNNENIYWQALGFLASKVSWNILTTINPTLNFQTNDVLSLPFNPDSTLSAAANTKELTKTSKSDWDFYETSWGFTNPLLLTDGHLQPSLKASYHGLRAHWREMTLEMQRLEQENNRIFIDAYGLQDELTPEVPLNEITLTCNPHYRYGGDKREEELEALLLADTMRELVSYAVGCMLGRYSLDKPGLILANQGETLADFVRKVASGQWSAASKEGESYAGEELQGSDRLAEGHGFGGIGIPSDKTVSQRGALRTNQSGAAGGGFDSLQHSGGASTPIVSGVQKLSVDSEGIVGGSGNTTAHSNSPQLSASGTTRLNHGVTSGNQQNDSGADGKTGHWPPDTRHLSFVPDEDNVIPMLDGDWFADDITLRFRQFLRVAFGEEYYEDNLAFIEQALNVKGKRNYSLRDYFLSEFYADHVKRYKKRPIYWLFSSPKGSFNALIYMHRYRTDTVSVVLKYLRDYREKLVTEKERQASASINPATSQGDKTRALKEVDRLAKVLAELEDYERDVLYPLATEQIAIDLDDGVKVNYLKFGPALKKITGLDAKDEE